MYLYLSVQIWHALILSPPITPAVLVTSALGQEFKSALTLIDWYSYSLFFMIHLEMATAHAKSKETQLEHPQQKQGATGFGTVSPIIQRVSRNTSGWEAQLQTSSPAQTQLSPYFNHNWANRPRGFMLGWESRGLTPAWPRWRVQNQGCKPRSIPASGGWHALRLPC